MSIESPVHRRNDNATQCAQRIADAIIQRNILRILAVVKSPPRFSRAL